MRTSRWTPSIVPGWADQTVYLVENDFGRLGRAFAETDSEYADLEATITALFEGQYSHPIRIVAFNTAERWSQDVSEDIAHELRRRCACNCATCPQLFKTSSKVTKVIASWRCGWYKPCPSSAKSRQYRHQRSISGLYRAGTGDL